MAVVARDVTHVSGLGYLSGAKQRCLLLHRLVDEPVVRGRMGEGFISTASPASHCDDANLLRRRRVLPYRKNK